MEEGDFKWLGLSCPNLEMVVYWQFEFQVFNFFFFFFWWFIGLKATEQYSKTITTEVHFVAE